MTNKCTKGLAFVIASVVPASLIVQPRAPIP